MKRILLIFLTLTSCLSGCLYGVKTQEVVKEKDNQSINLDALLSRFMENHSDAKILARKNANVIDRDDKDELILALEDNESCANIAIVSEDYGNFIINPSPGDKSFRIDANDISIKGKSIYFHIVNDVKKREFRLDCDNQPESETISFAISDLNS